MKVFAMSDIHGCIDAFHEALRLVDLSGDNRLILCGDYIHRGDDDYGVLNLVMELEQKYGTEKVIVLAGNHEDMACDGTWPIGESPYFYNLLDHKNDHRYLSWMQKLRRFYVVENTIFVHAGIDEEAEDWWQWGTEEFTFTQKYPAETGKFYMNIVAGHVGTAEISGDPGFHDIYFDGESHYYIDGTVQKSGIIPVLQLDTDTGKFYQMTEAGRRLILPYKAE
jgi:predicted phosphodiesterase